MANNPGARKSVRKIARRTVINKARRSRMRGFVRKVEEAISAGDRTTASAALLSDATAPEGKACRSVGTLEL